MAKIIGNTTATPNPRPDWEQTDSTKADYIKNKPTILTEEDIVGLIGENSSSLTSSIIDDVFNLEQDEGTCSANVEDNVLILSGPSGQTPDAFDGTVDQTYISTSENAQSGKAVAEAIDNAVGEIYSVLKVIVEGGNL